MEYNEGDIAEDGQGNFLVYRGGNWYPSNEQGRPLSRIPRPDYGDRYYELPNGDIVREGPKGGLTVVENAGGGRGGAAGPNGAPPITSEQRGRLIFGISPAARAQQRLSEQEAGGNAPMNDQWGAALLDAIPDMNLLEPVARIWGGQEYQDYDQAIATISASLLPIFSGMAVTESEAQRFIKANVPRVGDTPATLEQKARNRAEVINAGAWLLGRDLPFPDVGIYGVEGQEPKPDQPAAPTVNDGRTVQRADDALAVAPGEYAADYVARFDRDGDNRASVEEMQAAGWTFDYDAGKWFPPGSEGGSPPPAGPDGGQPPQGPQGGDPPVNPRGGGQFNPIGGFAAFQRGALGQLPLADEIIAGVGSALTGNSYGDMRRAYQGLEDYDRENNRAQRNLGGIAGATAGIAAGGAASGVGRALATRVGAGGRGLLPAAARGGAAGAGYGSVYGFGAGEGNALQRVDDSAGGAAIGALGGALAAPLARYVAQPVANALATPARAVGRGAGALGERLGVPGSNALREASTTSPLASAVDRFGRVSPQDEVQMRSRGNALSVEGIEPTFVDSVNDGGRGTLRATATRQTPGRDAAREFAEGRIEALPTRLSQQARRIVSSDARPVDEIVGSLEDARATQARTTYAEPYAQRVQIDPMTAQQLSGAPGRAAIQRARAAAEAFNDAPAMQELDALAAGETQEVSAATLDRIRQALSGRGEKLSQNPATRAVGAGLQQRAGIVDQALDSVEGLAPARQAYREASRQIDATQMGGRFMNANPDDFQASMQGLSPDQLQPARAATARSIEIAARNPGSAPGVARRLYADPETANMGRAVMGDDMDRLSQAARMEAQAVRNAIEINPRAGSPTNLNQQDTLGAAGEALGAARDVASGNILGLAGRAISSIRGQGFSDQEAEVLLQAAVDPARTDELIGMLSERMSRREARSFARAIRYQLTTGPQSGQQQ